MPNDQNAGLIMTGGIINVEVFAIGPGSHAEKIRGEADAELASKGLTEVKTKLEELNSALMQNSNQLVDPKSIIVLFERVAEQLAQKKPDKLTLKSFISTIAEETKSVATIATAALSLKEIVSNVF